MSASNGDLTKTYQIAPDLEVPPVRSLGDFLLGSARFQFPQFGDANRLTNRVLNNLLYYQTNYFILMAFLFLIISLFKPGDMIIGIACLGASLGIAYYFSTTSAGVVSFKKEYPLVSLGILVVGVLSCFAMASHMMTFVFALTFPLLITLIHASMRLRNMKNKIANQAEAAGVMKTVMGRILDQLGVPACWKNRLE